MCMAKYLTSSSPWSHKDAWLSEVTVPAMLHSQNMRVNVLCNGLIMQVHPVMIRTGYHSPSLVPRPSPKSGKRVWCSERHFLSHGAGPYFLKCDGLIMQVHPVMIRTGYHSHTHTHLSSTVGSDHFNSTVQWSGGDTRPGVNV